MEIIKKILEQENIKANKISKATSGFTNQVFFVDNYVIRLSNKVEIKEKLEKEISIYKNLKLDNIPKYISSGEIEDYKYLIISKVNGKPLYSIWHTLDRATQKVIVSKVVSIIKEFHKQNANFLDKKYCYPDFLFWITNELTNKLVKLRELGHNVRNIEKLIDNLSELFKENNYGLVYNDAHWDNFLYNNNKLYLIDFDRVIYAPLDYELLIFKTMCDIPDKFANDDDWQKCKIEDYDFIYPQFKSEYPELFNENTEKRVKIYQLNYLMEQAIKCNDNKWITELLESVGEKYGI